MYCLQIYSVSDTYSQAVEIIRLQQYIYVINSTEKDLFWSNLDSNIIYFLAIVA